MVVEEDGDDLVVPRGAVELLTRILSHIAAGQSVWACVQQIADSWRNPPGSASDVLSSLEQCGPAKSVTLLAEALALA